MTDVVAYIYFNETPICKITYREYSGVDFEYIFEPFYEVIDSLVGFKGIQGINLSLRKKEYVRKNIIPSFIYERSPLEFKFCDKKCYVSYRTGDKNFHFANRIESISLLEYLGQSNLKYFGDNLYIRNI